MAQCKKHYINPYQWLKNDFKNGLSFTYDGANRLLSASNPTGVLYTYKETETGISYDKNGNIKTLTRGGATSNVDQLTYGYGITPGNKLITISDGSGNTAGVKTGSLGDYVYDANGNMTKDANRNAVIDYNHLNLPKTVTVGTGTPFTYDYDASGVKHKYVADSTFKYEGGFEYNQANVFKRLALTDGQLVVSGGIRLGFDYYIKDHLGNVRVVFDQDGKIRQQMDYYPFGLEIDRNSPVQTPAARNGVNRYLYNGKELQAGSGYLDYGARMYMAEIGRWGVVDPLTDEQEAWSPYHYAYNSPVNYVDLYGLSPSSALGGNAIATCPTCPSDKKYDEYRDSKSLFTYDKGTGFVLNGDGKGATIYGQRNQESTFSGWEHAIGLGVGLPAVEIPKKLLGKATVGDASKVTTPISYLSNKLAESQSLQKLLGYKNVMSKRLFTHTRMINGQLVRFRTNLVGRYVGRWLGFGLARASMAITVYDIVDTANTNFQNMSLADQNRLLQTGQMSGSFIPNEIIQQQQENVKSHFDNE